MPTGTTPKTPSASARRTGSRRRTPTAPARRTGSRVWLWAALAAVVILGALFAVFRAAGGGSDATGHSGYQVGSPGIGQQAPDFTLPASSGGTISLAGLRGKTVLLYFQEGVGCEPCWTQLKDVEARVAAVHAAGVDQIVSITTQPVNLLAQKAHDEGISTPVLADTDLAVSQAYQANRYGMMGDGMDGHTFVLVGPDGTIEWRADYGGAPKYTMYVPVDQLLGDLKTGRHG